MNHHDQDKPEPGRHESRPESFMRAMGHLRGLYGPANRRTSDEPERHGHNPEDVKEEQELAGIEVETDSEGHHYGVRKPSKD
ncbi:hypothetical protein SCMU_08840 [Sinomonas cyclohexanicum]|uniref:Uncharacterized protein n=1 Tax=Sinomonas cyclohexanicum TaxID=322009 RepID=A0ABN6FG69_SINCY|nr:hypothetical protein [Corynebacterium cyclohexanicum]BCT75042.1 hypothetical protein SCMU_08840 [Corynebacterium cyclohexanicum]